MKTKISKRVISVVLAIVLAFSCTIPAFAATNYTATYTDKATKEVYSTILEDANKLLGDAALTGTTIQSVYAMVPGMKSFIPEADTAAFYKAADPEIFAKLDESAPVTAESLNAYFKENPVVVKDNADFATKLKTAINAIITSNIYDLVVMVIALGCQVDETGQMNPDLAAVNLPKFAGSIDNICKALGVEQELTLDKILLAGDTVEPEVKRQSLVTYIDNIIDGLLPDLSQNIVNIIQNIANDQNNILLYNGLTNLFPLLVNMIKGLEPMIGMFVPGLDLAPIKTPINNINDTIAKLPTVGEGEAKMFDLDDSVAYIINDVVVPSIAGKRMDVIGFGEKAPGMIVFDEFNLENLANAADTTDAFNVIFNYLYNNLNKDRNKQTLAPLLPLIPSVAPQVPADVVNYLTFVLENTQEDSAFQLYALLRIATGHSSDMGELTPSEPVVPVDPQDPTEPVNPIKPVNPVKPVIPGTTDTNVKAPYTGVEDNFAGLAMTIMGTAALGLVVVAIVSKKKMANNA